jgi:hypothetical protein
MTSSPLRELREEDAEAVAALFVDAFGEARPMDAEEIRSWLRNAELDPENLRVLEVDGRVAGYGDLWVETDEVVLDVAAPGCWETFLEWAEDTARSGGKRTRLHVPEGHQLAAIAEERGYRRFRSSFQMQIDLPTRPPAPVFPDRIDLRTYDDADEAALIAELNESFAEDPLWHEVTPGNFREFYLGSRGYDPSLWLLAWDGDELAGSSLCYPERTGEDIGWIGTLSVRPPWRRGASVRRSCASRSSGSTTAAAAASASASTLRTSRVRCGSTSASGCGRSTGATAG